MLCHARLNTRYTAMHMQLPNASLHLNGKSLAFPPLLLLAICERNSDGGSSGGARIDALRRSKSGNAHRPKRSGWPGCGPAPHPTRPAGLLRAPVSPQSVRGEVDCDVGSSGGARIDALRTFKAGHPPRPRRSGRPRCGPAPHPTRPAGLLRAPVSPHSVRGEVDCHGGSSGGARIDGLRRCKGGHTPFITVVMKIPNVGFQ
jgi:hypothetical protein